MSGWKDWAALEVVTETDFQSYIQDQVVSVFADSTARGTALGTAVSEGMVSYLQDTKVLQYYNGTAWANVSQVGDITAVTAGTGLSGGGASGDVTLSADISYIGSAVAIVTSQITDITASATELNYMDGVTSAVQTQLNTQGSAIADNTTAIATKVSQTNGTVATASTSLTVVRNITLSTATPTGGIDGDVWLVYGA